VISYQTCLAFAPIAALVVIAPGPATFLLLRNTPVQGRRAGLFNTAGIVAAVLSHATLSMMGLSAIVLTSNTLFQIIKIAAAAYLSYLGFLACKDAWQGFDFSDRLHARADSTAVSAVGAVSEGWLMNILNPKPSMFYLAIFPQFLDPAGNVLLQGATLATLHASICAAWFSCVVLSIDRIKALLGQPVVWRVVRVVTGLILIGFAARLMTLKAWS
jgi:threonine/homoserine/homoserine lactone efflux protein